MDLKQSRRKSIYGAIPGVDPDNTIPEYSNLIDGVIKFFNAFNVTFNTNIWKNVKDNELNNILINNIEEQFKLSGENSKIITILSDSDRDFDEDCKIFYEKFSNKIIKNFGKIEQKNAQNENLTEKSKNSGNIPLKKL